MIKIKVVNDGDWGGTVPNMLRHNELDIAVGDNLVIHFSGDDLNNLIHVLEERIQRNFEKALLIVKVDAAKDKLIKDLFEELNRLEEKESDKYYATDAYILALLGQYYSDYWMTTHKLEEEK